MGEREPDDQRLLLAGRGRAPPAPLWPVPNRKSETCGPTSVRPAAASRARLSRKDLTVAVLRIQRRAAAYMPRLRPPGRAPPRERAKNRRVRRRSRREPADAFGPRRRDGDAKLGRLALDCIEPCGIAPALLEELVAPAQRPFELPDPGPVAGVDGQHQPVEKPAPLARGAGEQRIHRRRQPDDPHMIAKRARRGDRRAVDAIEPLAPRRRARLPAGTQLMGLAVLLDFDRQREAAGAADPRAFRKLRPA